MATVLPPPSKRQKTAVAEKSKEQQTVESIPNGLGSIRVQFVDQSNGQSIGAPVSVPVVDATVRNLELLLNTLQGNDASERVPYRFTHRSRAKIGEDDKVVDIANDLYRSLLKTEVKTTEDIITLQYTPQAVFRVRAGK